MWVSRTVEVNSDRRPHEPGKPYEQARRCLEIIAGAVQELGGQVSDILRTWMCVTDITAWPEIARAHSEVFAQHPPVTAMVEVSWLMSPDYVVEIEAEGVITQS